MAEQQKPYVRYILEADICDKGLAFAMKRAIKAFLDNHGYNAKVTATNATSSNFVGVISLYDNGKFDFNVSALTEHLTNSGRMPSNANAMPKFTIKPLPIDAEYPVDTEKGSDDIQWQKTVQSLNDRIKGYESTVESKDSEIANMTHSLSERQRVLDEKTRKVGDLEKKLKETKPAVFDSSLTAVIDGYMKGSVDWLLDVAEDWTKLPRDDDANLDISGRDNLPGQLQYVNKMFGQAFRTGDELTAWVSRSGLYDSWEETPSAMEMLKKKEQQRIDSKVLKTAEESGASKEVLEALRKTIGDKSVDSIESAMESDKSKFETNKRLLDTLPEVYQRYYILKEVKGKIIERRSAGRELPVVIHCNSRDSTDSKPVNVYIPSFDLDNPLEKQIVDDMNIVLAKNGYNMTARRYNEEVAELSVLPKNGNSAKEESNGSSSNCRTADLEMVHESLSKTIERFSAFGLSPKVMIMAEVD